MRLWVIPFSTNVERIELALGHKGLAAERVHVDPDDRTPVRAVSGQDLVPVLEDGGRVVADSLAILRHLECRRPEPALWPADPARRAELDLFLDWFDRVWKLPPNLIADALDGRRALAEEELGRLGASIGAQLDRFEALLDGRDHLLGPFSAADCAAWPFLRYGLGAPEGDEETFHRVLVEHGRLDERRHPRLAAWVRRVAERPRG